MGTCENNCLGKPGLLQDLKVKIINVISRITVNQLANVFREQQNHITFCTANDGEQGKP